MEENKQVILNAFLPVLRMTRAGKYVTRLELTEQSGNEYVIITWQLPVGRIATGRVNVTGDSGAAMIKDVIGRLTS